MSHKKHNDQENPEKDAPKHFIKAIIEEDLRTNKHNGRVATRFPPEPNGYLHIGHAKAIHLSFGLAIEYNGTYNLRFDDTNPMTEETEYVESIKEDIHWLGFDWGDREYFASDYFDKLYNFAVLLVKEGKAYVCDLTEEQIREYRGNYYKKGIESPYRNRSVEENLDLLERMKNGEFENGRRVLRAKIDMAASNMNMRDPIIYRIRKVSHHRTGDKWCIYPMYDFAHCLSDAIERITHSLCSLEFEDHRLLYDWFVREVHIKEPPQQIEFARLNLSYTVMSKRKLLELVKKGYVDGWDDPRMPTLCAYRRRGYTPSSIAKFCEMIGIAKADNMVDVGQLEYCIRQDLEPDTPRVMAVLKPLKVVVDNVPEDEVQELEAPYLPEDFRIGSRKLPFSKVLYIEQDDFREDPPKKWHRLAPGREVRLRYAYLFTCTDVVKDSEGNIVEVHGRIDPESKGGAAPDGRRVKGTLHWVSAKHSFEAEVRLYDRLFNVPNPLGEEEGADFKKFLNPNSLETLKGCRLEPDLADAKPGERFQFERLGYFCVDTKHALPGKPVFNRTVALKDTWAKIERAHQKELEQKAKAKKEKTKMKTKNNDITIDDFKKIDLRVGVVKEARLVENADKLIRLVVDIGEEKPRTILSGIRNSYPVPENLIGKQVIVVTNLKPWKSKFGVSEGMVLAGGRDEEDIFFVATLDKPLEPGDKVT